MAVKKSFTINHNGFEIPAEYIEGKDDKPVVIMAHGLQGSKDEYLNTQLRIATSLQSFGFGSLRIDFRGHGDSKHTLSEFSLASQVEDLIVAVKWLTTQKGNIRIIPLGISFGAPPALILAEIYRPIVEKCVLIAPVLDYKSTFLYPITRWGEELFGYNQIIAGIRDDGLSVDESYVLRRSVLLDMFLVDIPSFVKKTDYEICVFHGKCDQLVPISVSKRLSSLRKNIELITLENTEHGLTKVGDKDFSSPISISNLRRVIQKVIY